MGQCDTHHYDWGYGCPLHCLSHSGDGHTACRPSTGKLMGGFSPNFSMPLPQKDLELIGFWFMSGKLWMDFQEILTENVACLSVTAYHCLKI